MARKELSDRGMRALTRGLEVLRHLNEVGQDTGPRIAASLSLSRATVGRVLVTLENGGLVRRDEATGDFCLASGVRNVSSGMGDKEVALWIATPVVYDLQQELLWPTSLATHHDGRIIIRESTHALSPYSIDSGMVGSSHSVLQGSHGRAHVAFCRDEDRAEYLVEHRAGCQWDDRSRTVERLIQEAQTKGYAYRQQGAYPKTSSIALPIRYRDRVVASVNVVWIASAMKFNEAVYRFYPALSRAQEKIERDLAADSARQAHVRGAPPAHIGV